MHQGRRHKLQPALLITGCIRRMALTGRRIMLKSGLIIVENKADMNDFIKYRNKAVVSITAKNKLTSHLYF